MAFFVGCLFLLTYCIKDITNPENSLPQIYASDTTSYNLHKAIYSLLQDYYLWYDSIPTNVNFHSYLNPQNFLNSIVYKLKDRWSFIITAQQYNDLFISGTMAGHGFSFSFDSAHNFRIAFVFKNSDLYKFGVRRGWIVEKINGVKPDTSNALSLLGPSEAGRQNTFLFKKPDGSDTSQTFTKGTVVENMVLYSDTLNINGKIVGYSVFYGFLANAETELNNAFDYFKSAGITDLILDLRYNGGGDLNIANYFAGIIGGDIANNKPFITLTYNNKHSANNQTYNIISNSSSVNLTRLFVITTGQTASASEALINGLKPYMDIKLIGSRTDGKPVGMNLWSIVPDNYVIAPITFKLTNKVEYGDYFAGLPVDQESIDDICHDFGDRNEACLGQAIYYIVHGNFAASRKAYYVPFNHHWKEWQKELGACAY